jgi:hypothetical protein
MILEAAQMLSTAHFVLDGTQVGYKPTHKNHPCSIWIRETSENYKWTFEHFKALCDEYTFRTGKVHKTAELIQSLGKLPTKIAKGGRTPFAMAMPESFKKLGIFDQTKAYQAYMNDKFKEWRCREKPLAVEWPYRVKPDWHVE